MFHIDLATTELDSTSDAIDWGDDGIDWGGDSNVEIVVESEEKLLEEAPSSDVAQGD